MTTSPRGDPVNEATARQHALRTASDSAGSGTPPTGPRPWVAILPNPSTRPCPYKVQYFAAFGLAGHQRHPTPQAALPGRPAARLHRTGPRRPEAPEPNPGLAGDPL